MPTDFEELDCSIMKVAKECLGEKIKYFPKVGCPLEFRGIFDNNFEQVDPDTEIVIASNQPVLGIKKKDLPLPAEKGDKVFIKDIEYRVEDAQEDGPAAVVLFLKRTERL